MILKKFIWNYLSTISSVREQKVKIMSVTTCFKSVDIKTVSCWDLNEMVLIVDCDSFISASKLMVKIPALKNENNLSYEA